MYTHVYIYIYIMCGFHICVICYSFIYFFVLAAEAALEPSLLVIPVRNLLGWLRLGWLKIA